MAHDDELASPLGPEMPWTVVMGLTNVVASVERLRASPALPSLQASRLDDVERLVRCCEQARMRVGALAAVATASPATRAQFVDDACNAIADVEALSSLLLPAPAPLHGAAVEVAACARSLAAAIRRSATPRLREAG